MGLREQQAGSRAFGLRCGKALDDGGQVQDQHDPAVAKNGGAADQIGGDGLVVQGFDDQFLFALESVDNEAELAPIEENDQNKDLAVLPVHLFVGLLAETHQRQNLSAKLQ